MNLLLTVHAVTVTSAPSVFGSLQLMEAVLQPREKSYSLFSGEMTFFSSVTPSITLLLGLRRALSNGKAGNTVVCGPNVRHLTRRRTEISSLDIDKSIFTSGYHWAILVTSSLGFREYLY